MQSDELKRRISAGRGDALADLVLRNARIVNVFTDEIDTADIAISGNCIVGVGAYHGRKEVDLHGKYVCPGLIDGHIHIESSITVEQVYKNGTLVAEHGKTLKTAPLDIDRVRFSHVMDSFDLDEITLQDLELRESGEQERVICLNRGELLTEEKIIPFQRHPGKAPGVDPEHNIVKLAVFERHHHSGHVGIGFLGNFSLKCGAVASSIAHDSHNLIVAGDNDTDMMLAGNTVRKKQRRTCVCGRWTGRGRTCASGGRIDEHRKRRERCGENAGAERCPQGTWRGGRYRNLYDPRLRQPSGHSKTQTEYIRHHRCSAAENRSGCFLIGDNKNAAGDRPEWSVSGSRIFCSYS